MQQLTPILLFTLAACILFRARKKSAPTSRPPLKGWQKIFGVLAFIVAILMVLNPEFLALGLLGDAAFFDILVLCLSLQFQMFATRIWRFIVPAISPVRRWANICLGSSMAFWVVAFSSLASAIQKIAHRISS